MISSTGLPIEEASARSVAQVSVCGPSQTVPGLSGISAEADPVPDVISKVCARCWDMCPLDCCAVNGYCRGALICTEKLYRTRAGSQFGENPRGTAEG